MKRFIQISSFLLILTGFMLTPILLEGEEVIAWVHLILGFFYSVAFMLFAYDHVTANKKILLTAHPRNLTGMLQLLSGLIVLLTGFVIYLYGSQRMTPLSEIHLGATIIFMLSLLIHFRSNKG